MKKIKLLLILALIVQISFAQSKEANNVNSEIKHVTVFPEGAEISRKASLSIKNGTHEYEIKGISQYIDEKSVRITGKGDFTLLSVSTGIDYLNEAKMTDEIENIEKKRLTLYEESRLEQAMLKVFGEEEEMILKINQ